MNQKELTETRIMISNLKNLQTLWLILKPVSAVVDGGHINPLISVFDMISLPRIPLLVDRSHTRFSDTLRPLGYERVYLPLYKVADTLFHI